MSVCLDKSNICPFGVKELANWATCRLRLSASTRRTFQFFPQRANAKIRTPLVIKYRARMQKNQLGVKVCPSAGLVKKAALSSYGLHMLVIPRRRALASSDGVLNHHLVEWQCWQRSRQIGDAGEPPGARQGEGNAHLSADAAGVSSASRLT